MSFSKKKSGFSTRKRYRDPDNISDCEDDDEDYNIYVQTANYSSGGIRRSSARLRKNQQNIGRPSLSIRTNSRKLSQKSRDNSVSNNGMRTVLAWLIDSGTVAVNQSVWYVDYKNRTALLEGKITREGVFCSCCSKVRTVLEFEAHAGGGGGSNGVGQTYQNIVFKTADTAKSLMQCQIEAWDRQGESARIGYSIVDCCHGNEDDRSDDVCGVCGDGGKMICCDGCFYSTYHFRCMELESVPQGNWHCPSCLCKFCGQVGTTVKRLLTCHQCEEKYHQGCILDKEATAISNNSRSASFCGQSCKTVFEKLQKLIGTKNELSLGLSWTLIRRLDQESNIPINTMLKRTEFNSKLAVVLSLMDECFMPTFDRRSGINMIQSVLYNCGSNFNRLNYRGFYTAILERGDEIISAASIRIHGTKLAEIPFVGTSTINRGKGMCRQLLKSVETALCGLNVENLIIPSVADCKEMWTKLNGFEPIEEPLRKAMKSLNIVMFPETVLLQKKLLLRRDPRENLVFKHDHPRENLVPRRDSPKENLVLRHDPPRENVVSRHDPPRENLPENISLNPIGFQSFQHRAPNLPNRFSTPTPGQTIKSPIEVPADDSSIVPKQKIFPAIFMALDASGQLVITRSCV